MVLQVFVSKHSSVVCRQHPADKLEAREQWPPLPSQKKTWKVLENNFMLRMSGSGTFVFLSELPVNYKLAFLWEGQNYMFCMALLLSTIHRCSLYLTMRSELLIQDGICVLNTHVQQYSQLQLAVKHKMHWVNHRILFNLTNLTHQLENSN